MGCTASSSKGVPSGEVIISSDGTRRSILFDGAKKEYLKERQKNPPLAGKGGRREKKAEIRRLAVQVEKNFDYEDEEREGEEEEDADVTKAENEYKKTAEEETLIAETLKNSYIFEGVTEKQLEEFVHSFHLEEVAAGCKIIEEGDKGDKLYIMVEGEAKVSTTKRTVEKPNVVQHPRQFSITTPDTALTKSGSKYVVLKRMKRGDMFGELALLYECPRAASVSAFTNVKIFVTDRKAFRRAIAGSSIKSLMKFLRDVPLFRYLTNNSLSTIAQSFTLETIDPHEEVVPYASQPGNFYIVKNGMILKTQPACIDLDRLKEVGIHGLITHAHSSSSFNPEEKKKMESEQIIESVGRCEFFGDRPNVSGECFDGRYVAGPDGAQLLVMTRDCFLKFYPHLKESLEDNLKFNAFKNIKMLEAVNETDIARVVDCFEEITINENENVFSQGEKGDAMYIIVKGRLCVEKDGEELVTLLSGSYFGEMALLSDEPRNATVRVVSPYTTLLKLDTQHFDDMLGPLKQIIQNDNNVKVLKKVDLFQNLSRLELDELAETMEPQTFEDGDTIIRQGEIGKSFYILKAGAASVTTKKTGKTEIFRFTEGAFFGERALLQDEPRNATITAVGTAKCLAITRESFETHLSSLKDLVDIYAQKERSRHEEKNTKLKDLTSVNILGCGTYGRVDLVQNKETKKYHALKIMSKSRIFNAGNQLQLKDEILCMQKLDHPFIISCPKAYGDKKYVYLLMESIMGGELHSYIYEQPDNKFKEKDAKFYLAQMCSALAHMYDNKIAHRDIKLENLMVDAHGYLRLVDFGFAKELRLGEKTFTFCGTPSYLAPEIITSQGHGLEVDLWSTGILAFELLFGDVPFDADDENELFLAIVKAQVRYPSQHDLSKEGVDFCRRLLIKDPNKRLGGGKAGAHMLKKHNFFKGFDWIGLERKSYKDVPLTPAIEEETDVSNFCEVTQEEITTVMEADEVPEDRIFNAILDKE